MTRQLDGDRLLESWLAEGPTELPSRAIDNILMQLDTRRTRQQVGWHGFLRRLHISGFAPALSGAVVVLVAAALALGLYVNQQGVGGPATPTPTPPNASPLPSPESTPSPTPSPRPLPASVPLSAGTYMYDHNAFTNVPFTFIVPDGWVVENGGWNVYNADLPSGIGFTSSTLDSINADACTGTEGEVVDAGSTVDDLVNALLDQSGPAVAVEGPFDVTVGGYSGQRLDVTSPVAADLEGCMVPGLQLWRDEAGNWFVVLADWQSSIYIVDVAGERVVLATQYQQSAPAADVAELEGVIDSIEFQL